MVQASKRIATTFQKGQSGNPGGRPKVLADIKALAQENGAEAFRKIVGLLNSKDERVVLAAAQEVLNRGYGKPHQSMDIGLNDKRCPSDFTDADLYAIAFGTRRGVAEDDDLPSNFSNGPH